MFHTQGVIAKRLGGGLQNRSDRFDSDSRLHFFAFFPIIVSNPAKSTLLLWQILICPQQGFLFALFIFAGAKMGLLTFRTVALASLRHFVGLSPSLSIPIHASIFQ